MADQKISQMPQASPLAGDELVPLVQSGVNVQTTTSDAVLQVLAVTTDVGINTDNPNSYPDYSTVTVGGQSSNTNGELDLVDNTGNSHMEFYKDGNDLVLTNFPNTTGDFLITADSGNLYLNGTLIQNAGPVEFFGTLKTDALTGYLKGNGNTGVVTASTTIPLGDVPGLGTIATQDANNVNITGGSISGTTVAGYVPTTRTISTGTGLSGGGDLSANRTLSITSTGINPSTYGSYTKVPVITFNAQGQATAASEQTLSLASINPNYGAFQNNATLTNTSPGTGIPMRFNTTDYSNGIVITNDLSGNATNITIANSGTYNFQFSAQLNKNGGGGAAIDVYIWMRKNGVDIPDTNTRVTLQGANVYEVAAWNFIFSANAGDKFQLMWGSADSHAEITYLGTPAIGPEIPAVILTVTQVA